MTYWLNKLSVLNIVVLAAFLLVSCTKQAQNLKPATTEELRTAFLNSLKDETGSLRIAQDSEYLIVLPDIQNYISNPANNKYLEGIISWILKFNNAGFKTKAVLQVGDLTNFNSEVEYQRVKSIFSSLDGKVNYIFCTGNHDYGDNGTANNRQSLFSNYFKYEENNYFVSNFETEKYDNTFFSFDIHGSPVNVISLEFGPRNVTIDWAKKIVQQNSSSFNIILTHAYLAKHQERYNYGKFRFNQIVSPYAFGLAIPASLTNGNVNDGEDIWTKLVESNQSIQLVLAGHITAPDYIGNLISTNSANKDVLQLLFNTQALPLGGEGWIQILEFRKELNHINVWTYSTLFNKWDFNERNFVSFEY